MTYRAPLSEYQFLFDHVVGPWIREYSDIIGEFKK